MGRNTEPVWQCTWRSGKKGGGRKGSSNDTLGWLNYVSLYERLRWEAVFKTGKRVCVAWIESNRSSIYGPAERTRF